MLNKDLEKKDKLVKAYNVKEAATGRFGCRFFFHTVMRYQMMIIRNQMMVIRNQIMVIQMPSP